VGDDGSGAKKIARCVFFGFGPEKSIATGLKLFGRPVATMAASDTSSRRIICFPASVLLTPPNRVNISRSYISH
jgi:hypothetical protein